MDQTATQEKIGAPSRPRPEQTSPLKNPVGPLIAPIKNTLIFACVLKGISSVAGVIPFIALAELGRVLLAEGPADEGRAWLVVGVAVGALVVRLVFLMASGGLTHLADADLQLNLRRRMAEHLSHVPLGWFTERNAGEVKKALQDDVTTLHHLVGHSYTDMVGAIITPIAAFGYLFWVDWRLALISALPLALGMFLMSFQYRGYEERMAEYNKALGEVNAAAVEFVQGIAVVKTFGQAQQAHGRFIDRTNDFVEYFWGWVSRRIGMSAAAETVLSPVFAMLVIAGACVAFVAFAGVAPVDVLPFIILGPGLAAPFMTLAYAQNDMMLAKEAAYRISALLNTPTLPDPTHIRTAKDAAVSYNGVSFSYDGETQVLSKINLTLEPGTVTALVGPSGSGKSTLARLLPRFWDPTLGTVSIGSVPITEISPSELYRKVGFVFQDVQLLRSSIAENIALGRPEATQDEIEAAAKAAQIHDRIVQLPRGYDSIAGEDALLSGGEAQRVSIARALLADTPILVLDEATAFSDPESEAAIQDALSTLIAGRTLLVIAHRLHTIVGADQICVLDKGEIVERGAHKDLLAHDGLYAKLWAASEAALDDRKGVSK